MAHKSKKTVAAKKPGPSGNFHGLRLQFLESEIDNFLSRVRTKSTPAYWPELFSAYWRRVQWRLDLSVETDAEMFEKACVPIDEDLSLEDEVLKKEILKLTHGVSQRKSRILITYANLLSAYQILDEQQKVLQERSCETERLHTVALAIHETQGSCP